MPLLYQHNINEFTRLGIWKIEEEEDFFSKKVTLQRTISHHHKRLQHLAGRYLLQFLFDDFPYELIMIADTRKPFLSNEAYHFSISHCGDFAAAIVSQTYRAGVDIELVKPTVQKIKYKFLSHDEMALLGGGVMAGTNKSDEISPALLTLSWSSKEAIYKWYGNGGVDFKNHIRLNLPATVSDGIITSQYKFAVKEQVLLTVRSCFFDELVLSYVVTGEDAGT